MDLEAWAIAVIGVGLVLTGLGQIRLWMKNGREAAQRNGVIDTKLEGIAITQIETRVDIAKIDENVTDQKIHCAKMTSCFTEKIKALEKKE